MSGDAASLSDDAFDAALIAAALDMAADQGWRAVSVAAAARSAGLSLARTRARFPSRHAILLGLGRMADQAVLAEVPVQGSVRDRLFDLLMRRIDAFQQHRAGVVAILRALPADPTTALMLACATRRSMRWMLEAAEVPASGLMGELRVRGLVAVWLWTVRAWERDDSQDLSATMAALDTALMRAEQFAQWRPGRSDAGVNDVSDPGADGGADATPGGQEAPT